jgi:hypothetical protein
MKINNLSIIKPLLKWDDPNDFYFVQILRRKKENPEDTSYNTVIATYYIGSMEKLDKVFPEMILLAKCHNARVYINLNRRNYEQLGLQMLKKVTDCLITQSYKDVRNAYNSVCGSFHVEKPKKWVIDTDGYTPQQIEKMKNIIAELGGAVYETIPTLNGMHLITNPFNTHDFGKKWTAESSMNLPDIQKNSPTLLYYSNEEFDILKKLIIDKD